MISLSANAIFTMKYIVVGGKFTFLSLINIYTLKKYLSSYLIVENQITFNETFIFLTIYMITCTSTEFRKLSGDKYKN